VNENISEMVPPRAQAENLNNSHMGQPGQRMPVGCGKSRKGPSNVLTGDAPFDMQIIRNIQRVIEVDELVITCLEEDSECEGK
jgi:hypothetical protein